MEEVKQFLDEAQQHMQLSINHLEKELVKIRAGKASPQMLDSVKVDYYGNPAPISQVASVTTPDARTISVQPWEKNMLTIIEKAIKAANLGFNPQNDGIIIRILVPPLTEERRKELAKKVKAEGELAKVSVRNIRRDAIEKAKKIEKPKNIPEDVIKKFEHDVQEMTNSTIARVDKVLATKEQEIMTI